MNMSKLKGKIERLSDFKQIQKIKDEIIKAEPYFVFRESPEDVQLKQIAVSSLSDLWNKGRLFNESKELRWTGSDYWLLKETENGEYEIQQTIFYARKNRKVEGFKYLKNGIVQFIRFKKIID